MPNGQVLVAICAGRCGTSIRGYAASRHLVDFVLDVQGWIQTWAAPLVAAMGGGEDGGGKKGSRSTSPNQRTAGGRDAETRSVVPLELMDGDEQDIATLQLAISGHTKSTTARRVVGWLKGGGLAAVKASVVNP